MEKRIKRAKLTFLWVYSISVFLLLMFFLLTAGFINAYTIMVSILFSMSIPLVFSATMSYLVLLFSDK